MSGALLTALLLALLPVSLEGEGLALVLGVALALGLAEATAGFFVARTSSSGESDDSIEGFRVSGVVVGVRAFRFLLAGEGLVPVLAFGVVFLGALVAGGGVVAAFLSDGFGEAEGLREKKDNSDDCFLISPSTGS